MPIEFQLISKDGGLTNRAIATWSRGDEGFTAAFDVKHRIGKGTYSRILNTTDTSLTVEGIKPGKTFEVQVRAVSTGFPPRRSAYAIATGVAPALPKNIAGSTNLNLEQAVSNVSNLRIKALSSAQAVLEWKPPTNEKLNNVTAVVKHSNKTDGTGSFANSVKLAEVPGNANSVVVPLLNGQYIVKLRDDTTDNKSSDEKSVTLNIPDLEVGKLIHTRREDQDSPPFQGLQRFVFYSADNDALVIDTDALLDELGTFDDIGDFDFASIRRFFGTYEFKDPVDLGGKFNVKLERILETRGDYPKDSVDDRADLVDTWSDWDGLVPDDTSAIVYFRTTDNAEVDERILLENNDGFDLEDGDSLIQESTNTFNDWTVLDKGTFVGRTFQFKAELETGHVDQTPLVDQLGYKITVPGRTENSGVLTSNAGSTKDISFTNAFYETPAISILAYNLGSGDYYEVTSTSRTGFTIAFKNSSNTIVEKQFLYVATGYGAEVS